MEHEDNIRKYWDLEKDISNDPQIMEKIKTSDRYRQNLYAALCNNEFQPQHIWPQLSEYKWSCSWRYAGGLVADIFGEGNYMDYYCSGIRDADETNEQGFVEESFITDEIKSDLSRIGWNVLPHDDGE